MALDLETQETLDNAKHLWQRVSPWLTWLLIVALVVFVGYRGWGYWQNQKGEQAALAFDAFSAVATPATAGDKQSKLIASLEQLQSEQGSSIYAQMASLEAAKQLVAAKNPDAALKALQWLIAQNDSYGYRALARLRAATILLDKKDYDAALAQLQGDLDPAYKTLAQDLEADIRLAQNKPDEAIAVLKAALAATAKDDPLWPLLAEKLSALGVDPTTLPSKDAPKPAPAAA